MAVTFYPATLETCATTGTGTLTLGGAVTFYQAFSANVATGRPVRYYIYDVDTNGNPNGNWEEGQGTYTLSGTTLTRDVVLGSSNAGALVNFTSGSMRVALPVDHTIPNAMQSFFFGDGSDGDVSVSSGTTTLTRDMYYRNLTLSGTGAISTVGWRVFVAEKLDLSAAPAGAIKANGTAGGTSSSATGGSGVSGASIGTIAGGTGSGTGGAGGAGTTGSNATGGAGGTGGGNNGGLGGAGSAGANNGFAGGTGSSAAATNGRIVRKYQDILMGSNAFLGGGTGGGAGGGGGGSSTGGGGGGGGQGGGVVFISANQINRGGSTATSAIQALGGTGGTGSSASSGGGGAGAGGGGGWLYICYGMLQGTTATNALDASSGAGGVGGNGTSAGAAGGAGGAGGRITLINLGANTVTETTGSTGGSGGAASGTTGGIAGTANTFRANL